jgi:hypothetical protein
MTSSLEISAIIILIILIGGLIYLNILDYFTLKKSKSASLYRSFIVPDGKSITLSAPSGYTLSIDQVFVGTGPVPGSTQDTVTACYSAMQDLDSSCKMSTPVFKKGSNISLSTTISDKVSGQTTATISEDDVTQTIYDSGRGSNCIPTSDCTAYVFGTYECVPS